MSAPNPKTGPALARALSDALPGWTIEVGCRAAFAAGTVVRIQTPDGRLMLLASRGRREITGGPISFYQDARPEHQGAEGFARLVADLRDAAARSTVVDGGASC